MTQKKSALVVGVGASRGLGAAVARRFAREGFHVVVAGRTAEKLERVVTEIRATGGSAQAVIGDGSNESDAARFVASAEEHGSLELVLHNAGSNRRDAFLDLETSDFEALWREHCLGGFLTGRESARRMVPRGRGTILFTGASGSLRGRSMFAAFAAAKAGLRATAQSMARELGPKGIHVAHVVIDGGIEGDRLLSAFPGRQNEKGPDGLLSIDAIAETYWQLHLQHRSAWTHELELRPWTEAF
ncbi:MAG: SDR family NAD(P)-dependent oxidoreductase [Undibacterium sp.]|uniref:SDR family NAD(P)-dependent oxidoreductase n=1 Tax=Undibacterium sp. TaxID=1914977 RepID=UPI0027272F91|nr:SDR family NAD(P)-dependent oxidoreductase [Undibacterium sp.]MDO8652251.1 SDR family NAD(P)-dependent oxidoreductase [Undibacterium sp.]